MAKKILELAEKYHDPRATDFLSCQEKNPLISFEMMLRAAGGGTPSFIDNLAEDYEEQANWWHKKIAEAEGKTFDGKIVDDENIFDSKLMEIFNTYKKAFDGDVDSMKTCLEFCEKEFAYWDKLR